MFVGHLAENWLIGKRHYASYEYICISILPSVHTLRTHRPRALHFFCAQRPFVADWYAPLTLLWMPYLGACDERRGFTRKAGCLSGGRSNSYFDFEVAVGVSTWRWRGSHTPAGDKPPSLL